MTTMNMNGHITQETLLEDIRQLENQASVALANHHRLKGASEWAKEKLALLQSVPMEKIEDGNNDITERT